MTKKVIVGLLLATASFGTIAAAADMPAGSQSYKAAPQVVQDMFAGWWADLGLGYGWGSANAAGFNNLSPSGLVYGGGFGYRSQTPYPNVYFGLFTELNGADVSASNTPFKNVTDSFKDRWYGTTTAQLGWQFLPGWLASLTGGVAYGGVSNRVTFNGGSLSDSETRAGWTVGARLEYALRQSVLPGQWTVGVDYQHVDLGKGALCGTVAAPFCVGVNISNSFDVVKAGLNYKFGS